MKLSTETYLMRERFDDETAIKMIKDAGFDCYDYSMYWVKEDKDMLASDYKEKALKLRAFSDGLGIECNQAHAPFDLKYTDQFNMSNENYCRLVRSMKVASILGAKTIIIHAIKDNLPETVDFKELNREFYGSLLPYCKKFKICVSVENLFVWEEKAIPILSDPIEHQEFVKSLNSHWFNICVDIGHSAITGYNPEDVLSAMDNSLLKSLHIHDNDFKMDRHLIPYAGNFDWKKITTALRNINYNGELTFEIFGFLNKLDDSLLENALYFSEKLGRKLIMDINEFNSF